MVPTVEELRHRLVRYHLPRWLPPWSDKLPETFIPCYAYNCQGQRDVSISFPACHPAFRYTARMWNRAINTTSWGIGQVCVYLVENNRWMNSHGTNSEAELHVRPRLLSWKVSFRRIANYYLSLRFESIGWEREKDRIFDENFHRGIVN